MSKKVLVTGGAGFVGSNIIRYILSNYSDYRVINLDSLTSSASLNRLESEENNPLYTFYQGDIAVEKDVQYVFEQYKPDYVIHLASQSYIDKNIHQPSIFIQTNVVGTQNILLNLRENKSTKMIHLSTSKVYGSFSNSKDMNIDEDSRLLPYDPYVASKAAADMFVMANYRSQGLNVNIIRPTNVYGDYQFPEKLIPTTIESCIRGKRIPVYGNGTACRDWLHVKDFCKAVDLIIHGSDSGKVYNLSWGQSFTNIYVVEQIVRKMGDEISRVEFLEKRLGDESYPTIKSERIRKELGWEPGMDLDRGLNETIKWYKNNSDWVDDFYTGEKQRI